jgi:ABC-type nitrate/sulfonate/bicarbonate transport system permease component
VSAREHTRLPVLMSTRPARKEFPRLSTLTIGAIYVGLVICWEVFGRDVNPYFSSYPSAIVRAGIEMMRSGELLQAVGESSKSLLFGLVYSLIVGFPVGFLIGRYKLLNHIFGPIVNALFVVPREVFVPLLVLWFGISDMSRVVFIFLSSVFPLIYNVTDGVRNVSSAHVDTAKAYGASELQVVREVTTPAILPFIGIGVKQAIARGLTGLIAAEFFIGVTGMGGLLQKASATYRLDRAFVVIFALVLVGFVLTKTGELIEARLGRWRKTERAFQS